MNKLKYSFSGRRLALWISGILSFLAFLLLYGSTSFMKNGLQTQRMADRWSEDGDAAQVSCFFSPNAGIDTDAIEMFRHSLDSALQEASITQDSPNAGARLWADAYSADGQITVSSDRATVTADAIGVGGDFFLFHPLQLLNGAYFSESDLNQDYCILDEDSAWQLFGSNNVAGMTVSIGGTPHIVTGVIHREEGRLAEAAGLDSTVIYVSYDTLTAYGRSNGINHYEIVMPNPVKNYAYNYVMENMDVSEKETEIVENSSRYDLLKRFQLLAAFGTRSMNGKAIIYPYWENIARGYEDIIALLTLFAALFFLYPAVLLIILIVVSWRHKSWTAKGIYLKLQDRGERKMEELRAKRRRKKQHRDSFDDEEELL